MPDVTDMSTTVEALVDKAERLQAENTKDLEESAQVMANLDKLTKLVSNIEAQKDTQEKLASAVESIIEKVDQVLVQQNLTIKETGKKDWQGTFKKVVKGTRITAQVVDVVANSLDVIIDTVLKIYQRRDHLNLDNAKTNSEVDMAAVLKPINTVLQALFTPKETEKPADEAVAETEPQDKG